MKFRIVKIETVNGKNEVRVHYEIQRKFLFLFFKAFLKTHYYTHVDWNHKPGKMAFITKRIFTFDTEEHARHVLFKLKNPLKQRYKGELIERVFEDYTLADVYINRSHYRYWAGEYGYEYADTLDLLKDMIDKRKTKTKTYVVE